MMTTRLGLISDVHASPIPLRQALEIFDQHHVSDIICAGDIAGYFDSLDRTVELLKQYNCKVVIGNHDQSYLDAIKTEQTSAEIEYLQALPNYLEFELENKSIYVVHADPPESLHGGIKLLDQYGHIIPRQSEYWKNKLLGFSYDVLVVGHTHQVYAVQLGDVLVVNPGSSQFNHSCMILELPALTVQIFALENRKIEKSWNFSMLYGHNNRYPFRKH